ncbi:hypothetical protein [Methylobacterium sp. ID0610]|uniref:hypothetical protein n=1 Tax=Methylobacterium carpenticola TaxID=3344827 RepID=UPI0036C6E583
MIRFAAALAAILCCALPALAEAPPSVAPGVPFGTGTQPVVVYDAQGNVVSSFGGGGGGGGGSVTAPGTAGTQAEAVQGVPGGVPLPISAAALPLPAGAATAAAQATGNTSLASIVNGPAPTSSFSIARTGSIGTTAVQVSGADTTNRRTVTNTSAIGCELMPAATAYGTGYPLPAGGSFTFDASGRTTGAIFVACSAAGGTVAVISY